MSTKRPIHIAIVGSGPSGCFMAQALHKAWPEANITIFDRLAVPYGLIRYGVAADHQHTKAVTRQFDRMFTSGQVCFAGNIDVGVDVGLDQLRAHFDVVVLASGRWRDRPLAIPGARLPGVIVAGDIVNALNVVPRPALPMPVIGRRVIVVGAGNVAFDMVRFLIKTPADFADSDISDPALSQYQAAPARRVTLLSRSPIALAKADVAMVKELSKVGNVRFTFANSIPATATNHVGRKREAAFAELADRRVRDPRVEVHFVFGAEPGRVRGVDHVEELVLKAAPSGEPSTIPADTIISAIGFDVNAPGHWHYARHLDFSPSDDSGRIENGLYRVGWLKRGPHGAIPANRADAYQVAKEIIADVESGQLNLLGNKRGYIALPVAARQSAVSFEEWQRIDAYERASAPSDRIRKKISNHATMLDVAHSGSTEQEQE